MGLVGEIGQEGAPVCTDYIVDLPSVRIFYHLDFFLLQNLASFS